jgi:hypothetical protein
MDGLQSAKGHVWGATEELASFRTNFMRFLLFASLVAVCCLSGCGSSTETSASGKVTLNGQPLAFGMIQFKPGFEGGPTASMQIVNGEYHGPAFPGTKQVFLSAAKVIGKRKRFAELPDSPEREIVEEILPSRYNTQSELSVHIKPGANQFNFDLTTP